MAWSFQADEAYCGGKLKWLEIWDSRPWKSAPFFFSISRICRERFSSTDPYEICCSKRTSCSTLAFSHNIILPNWCSVLPLTVHSRFPVLRHGFYVCRRRNPACARVCVCLLLMGTAGIESVCFLLSFCSRLLNTAFIWLKDAELY